MFCRPRGLSRFLHDACNSPSASAAPNLQRHHGRRREGQSPEGLRPRHHQLFDRGAELPAGSTHVYAAAAEALTKDSGQYGSNRGADVAARRVPRRTCERDRTDRLYAAPTSPPASAPSTSSTTWPRPCWMKATPSPSPVPYWTTYLDIADIVNAKAVHLAVPGRQDYKMTPAQLDAALASRSRRCSCSTTRTTRPAWSIPATKSSRWPTCW